MAYQPVKEGELQIGQPVPWALYDVDDNLLLARGVVIETAHQLEELMRRGLFRRLSLGTVVAPRQETSAEAPRDELRGLEEIKLAIGDQLQLQAESAAGTARYYVKLIGYLRGRGVIVSTPKQDGKVLLMREGQTFVVRLFSGQSIYAFSATVVKAASMPFPHLHLSWPSQVKGLVVRRGARARVSLIAAVQDVHCRAHAGTVVNLSTGGCSLVAKAPLGIKEDRVRVKFRVAINGCEQYLDLEGTLRAVNADAAEDGTPQVQHGIQFADMAASDQMVLTAYVYQRLFEESTEA